MVDNLGNCAIYLFKYSHHLGQLQGNSLAWDRRGVEMKLEDQVCSLELAKKLKELNCKQESLWWWNINKNNLCFYTYLAKNQGEYISAFTCAELGKMLPICVNGLYFTYHKYGRNKPYIIEYGGEKTYKYKTRANTEANARAKCLIYLLENKLMELK